jgi:arylsulfatase A-like enzyme
VAAFEGTAGPRRWWWLGARLERANRTGKASRAMIRLLESRYRANIRYVDAAVGALVSRLGREGLYEDSLLVLTADHGEAFFKHGRFGHNATLYDDMTRVPLLMKFPERDRILPRRIPDLVETIDVPATLCDYLGIPAPPGIEGDSLWPLLRGDARALAHPEVVIATRSRDQHAVRDGDRKYIHHAGGREELYDLARDPDEQHDLAHEDAGTVRRLRETLARVMGGTPESPALHGDAPVPPETRRLLEALGYVGEGGGGAP